MYDIQISQTTYEKAVSAARAERLTVEQFVEDAVQQRLEGGWDEPDTLTLSPDQMAKVRKAQAEIRDGKGMTSEQVAESLAARRAAWLAENQP